MSVENSIQAIEKDITKINTVFRTVVFLSPVLPLIFGLCITALVYSYKNDREHDKETHEQMMTSIDENKVTHHDLFMFKERLREEVTGGKTTEIEGDVATTQLETAKDEG